MSFPKDFFWGAATSSYQIEGAYNIEGRGQSVWDTFCNKKNVVWNNQNGNTACSHYYQYKDDVSSMKNIGLNSYRLSISWPRVIPEGIGKVNQKGLDFYDKLVDELIDSGIEPFITLFHWDYPYELYAKGGWLNNDSPEWFFEYTKVIVDKLSDRVRNWITLNEPRCFVISGHEKGVHAPGDKLELKNISTIAHNALLAHGKAVQIIRSRSKQKCKIGFAPVGTVSVPATESKEDIKAARLFMFDTYENDLWHNSWWMDPVYLGKYPENGLEFLKDNSPAIKEGDMETISQPLDFFGITIYQAKKVKADEQGNPVVVPFEDGREITLMNWFVEPECLYWGPKFFYERYKTPIIIAENGMSNIDWVSTDGKVHDPQRINFLTRHLKELKRALEDNVDVSGYFHWSLMDNFEWAEGYKQRFGLIYIDYPSQKRILKDSAYWYKEVIKTNGNMI